jgi:hypothetical protein
VKPTIHLDEMRERVGRAMYKEDWLAGAFGVVDAFNEDWLLIKGPYGVKRRATPTAAGIYPSEIAPCPRGKAKKLERALGRFARLDAQIQTVDSWLEAHGLSVDPRQPADRATFDTIMSSVFPNAPPARRGPKPEVMTRVLKEMEADVTEGRLTVDQLRKLKLKQLAERYAASISYVRDALRLFLKPHEQTPKTNK